MSSLVTLPLVSHFQVFSVNGRRGERSFSTSSIFDIKRASPGFFFLNIRVMVMPEDTCVCPRCQGWLCLSLAFGASWWSPNFPVVWEKGRCSRKSNILLWGMDLGMGWDPGEDLGGCPSHVQGGGWLPALPQPSTATSSQPAGCHWGTLLPYQGFPWRADEEDVFLLLPR